MDEVPYPPLLGVVAAQLNVSPAAWALYARRDQTRREYLVKLQQRSGFQPFTQQLYRKFIHELDALADQTYQGIALAYALIEAMRRERVSGDGKLAILND
jgi:hypothetical protein